MLQSACVNRRKKKKKKKTRIAQAVTEICH